VRLGVSEERGDFASQSADPCKRIFFPSHAAKHSTVTAQHSMFPFSGDISVASQEKKQSVH